MGKHSLAPDRHHHQITEPRLTRSAHLPSRERAGKAFRFIGKATMLAGFGAAILFGADKLHDTLAKPGPSIAERVAIDDSAWLNAKEETGALLGALGGEKQIAVAYTLIGAGVASTAILAFGFNRQNRDETTDDASILEAMLGSRDPLESLLTSDLAPEPVYQSPVPVRYPQPLVGAAN